jgi:hypothetical protein
MAGTIDFRDNGSLQRVAELVGERLHLFGDQVVERARDNSPYQTGNLRRSIHAEKTGPHSMKLETRCGYGAYVELGTARRPATPYLAPAVQETVADLEASGPWA